MTFDELNENLLQAVFGWLKLAAGLADAQVAPADSNTSERQKPYVTVRIPSDGIAVGKSERYTVQMGGKARPVVRQMTRGVASIQGFGERTQGWLNKVDLARNVPGVLKYLFDNALTLQPIADTQNISTDMGQGVIEARFNRDFDFTYILTYTDDTGEVVPAKTFELDSEFVTREDDPNPLPVDITESI